MPLHYGVILIDLFPLLTNNLVKYIRKHKPYDDSNIR